VPFQFKDGSFAGTCNICGEKAWTPRSNKCEAHKHLAKSHKSKKAKRTGPAAADPTPATSFVEAAGEITPRTFSAKAPSASEWEEKLTALVVLATMTYVEYAVVRPFHLPEPTATEAVNYLGMTNDEASKIVEPCSFLIARSEINKKHGREALEILAFAPALLAIVSWADRVSTFRQQMQAQLGENSVRLQGPSTTPRASETPSGVPVANFGAGVWDPSQAPTAGVNGDRPHVDSEDRAVSA
jgi:hypothetical protein